MHSYKKNLIVQITPTPLVGSPLNIDRAINQYSEDFQSVVLCLKPYPPALASTFSNQMIFLKEDNKYLVNEILNRAAIIHVHNFIEDEELIENLLSLDAKKVKRIPCIYQVHSPVREGPIFYDNFTSHCRLLFDKKFVIGQYQSRIYQNFTPVPNIVNINPSISCLSMVEKARILFSPSHMRTGGRWNNKSSKVLNDTFDTISRLNEADIFKVSSLNHYELLNLRRLCQISIDEIVTGAFHQVSLESMACGNVVINNADDFCLMQLSYFAKNHELPPFIRSDENSIKSVLIDLIRDNGLIEHYQQKSYNYFIDNLQSNHLINFYLDEYRELI